MVEVAFRYMPKFDYQDKVHKDARGLGATWSKAFEKLRYELKRINATDVIVEAGYQPSQVRADGWPYSSAKPEHHCVRVSFKAQGKTALSFAYNGWRDVELNVYMIALTLERLRAVERYGCTQANQQYAGWAQLPPAASERVADWPNVEAAAAFLWCTTGTHAEDLEKVKYLRVLADREVLQRVYRDAAKRAHPDQGGTPELMATVNSCREVLERNGWG